jgi:N-acetyl-gamma-glutamyl-phosphate reductase
LKPKIFVDGSYGTTGLRIMDHLTARNDLEILMISPRDKKNLRTRMKFYKEADVVILCLPDEAAKEAVKMICNTKTKIIDASSAHRCAEGWVYGLPEIYRSKCSLIKLRHKIRKARLVSVPGCYATGFALCVNPLVCRALVDSSSPIFCTAITGYSGGGKKMIKEYESSHASQTKNMNARPKNLDGNHRHLPEMKKYSFLDIDVFFLPIVDNYYQGMRVCVSLVSPNHDFLNPENIRRYLAEAYDQEKFIKVIEAAETKKVGSGFLKPMWHLNQTNGVEISVFGRTNYVNIIADLDNLGKGSSGAAIQNMNLMLGLPETTGLIQERQRL